MSKTQPCPHCGKDIDITEFLPPTRGNRFSNMSPEQRKMAASEMAKQRWKAKRGESIQKEK